MKLQKDQENKVKNQCAYRNCGWGTPKTIVMLHSRRYTPAAGGYISSAKLLENVLLLQSMYVCLKQNPPPTLTRPQTLSNTLHHSNDIV